MRLKRHFLAQTGKRLTACLISIYACLITCPGSLPLPCTIIDLESVAIKEKAGGEIRQWLNRQVCPCSWESEKAQWHTYTLQVRVTLVLCQARILHIQRKIKERKHLWKRRCMRPHSKCSVTKDSALSSATDKYDCFSLFSEIKSKNMKIM